MPTEDLVNDPDRTDNHTGGATGMLGADAQTQIRLTRLEEQGKALKEEVSDLKAMIQHVVTLLEQRGQLWRHVCTVFGKVLSNDNGQLKYIAAIVLGLTALAYGIPVALTASGVTIGTVTNTIHDAVTLDVEHDDAEVVDVEATP